MSTEPINGQDLMNEDQDEADTLFNEHVQLLHQGASYFVVKDRDLSSPPGSPTAGDAYLVASSATGAWAGHDGKIAMYTEGGWIFASTRPGIAVYVLDEDGLLVRNAADSAWRTATLT